MTDSQHTKWSKKRTRSTAALVLAIAMACFIFFMSSIPGSGLPPNLGFWTIVAHFSEFAVFAALVAIALDYKVSSRLLVVLLAVVIASAYGASDEFHQLFVPGRFTDVADWITDTCGALFGSLVATKILAVIDARSNR